MINARWPPAVAFLAYRYRFLAVYIVVGVLSLLLELVTFRGLERFGVPTYAAAAIGLLGGILFAYWGNVRFSFKIPIAKRQRALGYFVIISLLSFGVQSLLRRWLDAWAMSYEQSRLGISGAAFLAAYLLHRRFSFADFKKVGVAVYANGIEDIAAIHRSIENFPDLIHVDIVDASYGHADHEVKAYRLEVVRAYWPRKPIQVHLMTRTPSRYLAQIYPFADRIFVHVESDENIGEVLAEIGRNGREAGLALTLETPLEAVRPHIDRIAGVLLLGVRSPGRSGQAFELDVVERIAAFNRWPERGRVDVTADGGVTEHTVGLLNVEIVISGSSVLTHYDPRRQIMRLQTSSSYEQI
jgi:ribulose-phosphate 3-epimerase